MHSPNYAVLMVKLLMTATALLTSNHDAVNRVFPLTGTIELPDLQGTFGVNGASRRTWMFSKLARGESWLTLRNENGAILRAQIIAQPRQRHLRVKAVP
jgi:hypothetical protein